MFTYPFWGIIGSTVNHKTSLTWNVRLFWDSYPVIRTTSNNIISVREIGEVVIKFTQIGFFTHRSKSKNLDFFHRQAAPPTLLRRFMVDHMKAFLFHLWFIRIWFIPWLSHEISSYTLKKKHSSLPPPNHHGPCHESELGRSQLSVHPLFNRREFWVVFNIRKGFNLSGSYSLNIP